MLTFQVLSVFCQISWFFWVQVFSLLGQITFHFWTWTDNIQISRFSTFSWEPCLSFLESFFFLPNIIIDGIIIIFLKPTVKTFTSLGTVCFQLGSKLSLKSHWNWSNHGGFHSRISVIFNSSPRIEFNDFCNASTVYVILQKKHKILTCMGQWTHPDAAF